MDMVFSEDKSKYSKNQDDDTLLHLQQNGGTLLHLQQNGDALLPLNQDGDALLHLNQDGDSLLHLSILHGRLDLIERLLAIKESVLLVNSPNNLRQCPLHLAAMLNKPRVVRMLIMHDAHVASRDRRGNTPLHLACQRGHYACVRALTAPPTAAEVMQYTAGDVCDRPILSFQVIPQDGRLLNYEGLSCIHLAASHQPIMEHLINTCGYNINIQHGCSGETLLHTAVNTRDFRLLQRLLQFPSLNINARRFDGCTAYCLAQGHRDQRDFSHLLKIHGADIALLAHQDDDEDDDQPTASYCDEHEFYGDWKIGGTSPVLDLEDLIFDFRTM